MTDSAASRLARHAARLIKDLPVATGDALCVALERGVQRSRASSVASPSRGVWRTYASCYRSERFLTLDKDFRSSRSC